VRGTDWFEWHRHYEDPGSRFSRRLAVLQRQLGCVLDRAAPGRITVVSVCAGQGHDLLGVLADHPRRHDVVATLIELDPGNAAMARSRARELGLSGISVAQADAGLSDAYVGAVPASLIILSGFWTYLDEADVARTLAFLPQICARGAIVVWARGRSRINSAARIRSLFQRAGFAEIYAEDIEHPGLHVGVERFEGIPLALETGRRLFRFRDPRLLHSSRLRASLLRLSRHARSLRRRALGRLLH
jgi:hypothetical protein